MGEKKTHCLLFQSTSYARADDVQKVTMRCNVQQYYKAKASLIFHLLVLKPVYGTSSLVIDVGGRHWW